MRFSDRDAFLHWMSDPEQERTLLEGSSVYGGRYVDWEASRQLIASAIHRSGSVLDIGCANGFLLLCLALWSPHTLLPYGIDVDETRLATARHLHPEAAAHFVLLPMESLQANHLEASGLPSAFDFVYWNVWDDIDFQQPWQAAYFQQALNVVRADGRLILGFYDRDLEVIQRKLRWLSEQLGRPTGQLGPVAGGVIVAYWDVSRVRQKGNRSGSS